MSDGQFLWLLVAVFYVSECCYWVPRSAVLWRLCGKRWVAGLRVGGIGNEKGQLLFWNPLGEVGGGAVFEGWPFSVSSSGVSSGGWVKRWEDVGKVWAEGNRVRVDGRVLGWCASDAAAWGHAGFLEKVRVAGGGERAGLIREAVEQSLDGERAMERWGKFWRDGRWARLWCAVVGWSMLVWVPVVYWRFGDGVEVLVAAGVMWVAMLVAAVMCLRLHGRWFKGGGSGRWQNLAVSVLAPPHAARGVDGVSRNVMAGVHPLAPARDEGGRYAAALRDAWFPAGGGGDGVEREFREEFWKPALEAGAEVREIVLEDVLGEPVEREEESEWYCPRCHGGYVEAVGTCASCEGVELRRFLDGRQEAGVRS